MRLVAHHFSQELFQAIACAFQADNLEIEHATGLLENVDLGPRFFQLVRQIADHGGLVDSFVSVLLGHWAGHGETNSVKSGMPTNEFEPQLLYLLSRCAAALEQIAQNTGTHYPEEAQHHKVDMLLTAVGEQRQTQTQNKP